MHFLSHHREARIDPGGYAGRHGPSHFRLRHLPGRLPLEPQGPGLVNPALAWLAEMSVEEFSETFRGSPIRRTKRSGLRRNAAIAMGNSGNQKFLPLLKRLTVDEDSIVAESAIW